MQGCAAFELRTQARRLAIMNRMVLPDWQMLWRTMTEDSCEIASVLVTSAIVRLLVLTVAAVSRDRLDSAVPLHSIARRGQSGRCFEDHEDEKSCSVCLNDYETDQEVCRLPCNHFCCRVCTEKMFSTPNQGLKSNILCPICRDDCS